MQRGTVAGMFGALMSRYSLFLSGIKRLQGSRSLQSPSNLIPRRTGVGDLRSRNHVKTNVRLQLDSIGDLVEKSLWIAACT